MFHLLMIYILQLFVGIIFVVTVNCWFVFLAAVRTAGPVTPLADKYGLVTDEQTDRQTNRRTLHLIKPRFVAGALQ